MEQEKNITYTMNVLPPPGERKRIFDSEGFEFRTFISDEYFKACLEVTRGNTTVKLKEYDAQLKTELPSWNARYSLWTKSENKTIFYDEVKEYLNKHK